MNRGQLPTNIISDSNWGAFDHASRAPQLLSDNYSVLRIIIIMCTCMHDIVCEA